MVNLFAPQTLVPSSPIEAQLGSRPLKFNLGHFTSDRPAAPAMRPIPAVRRPYWHSKSGHRRAARLATGLDGELPGRFQRTVRDTWQVTEFLDLARISAWGLKAERPKFGFYFVDALRLLARHWNCIPCLCPRATTMFGAILGNLTSEPSLLEIAHVFENGAVLAYERDF